MGTSRTPKYIVQLHTPGFYNTPSEWSVRGLYGGKGCGKPTDANLAKYVEQFEKSMLPGGANDHLAAKNYHVVAAYIYLNNGRMEMPLAQWRAA